MVSTLLEMILTWLYFVLNVKPQGTRKSELALPTQYLAFQDVYQI